MERLTWKIRISVLWLFMAVAMSAHSVLAFMERDVVEQMWEMQMGAGMLVFMALFWLVPLIMAALSLTLEDSANRWTNIVLGIVFTLLNIWHLVEHLTTAPAAHQILIIASTVVVTALIAWYAWKWPKQEA
jgi:predicted membrane channel-forming protein YqfA (hemolysin III family)